MATLKEAVTILKRGGLVAFPTESFYALGADATNPKAVKLIYTVKGREKNKPIALIAGNWQQVERFFVMNKSERNIATTYWPGALTLLLKPKTRVAARALVSTTPDPSYFRRGNSWKSFHKLTGVRIPGHAQARALALKTGSPITATSLNISGLPPTKSRRVVQRNFPGLPVLSGTCGRATKPSTVAVIDRSQIVIIRKGAIGL